MNTFWIRRLKGGEDAAEVEAFLSLTEFEMIV